ncbi:hypothetical protein AcV5_003454 [Taiwanofungus camphoratus]|nr:hypothetical protein AcV5_003454 [Antrodia cinnamomea]
MFSAAIQPGIVSLFSSTGSDPLRLFSSSKDVSLPADSFVCLLKDSTSLPAPPRPATLMQKPPSSDQAADGEGHAPDHAIEQTVLHIQSPTLRTTFIRCPPTTWTDTSRGSGRARSGDLGMKHPWIHFQVRNMAREWSFEIGIVDQSGREGIVRCSTFQKEPRVKLANPPLLHLPLAFPSSSSHPLTSWCSIALNLPSFLPHFSSAALARSEDEAFDHQPHEAGRRNSTNAARSTGVPSGTYSHVSYVKVYATCRLRRIWFSEGGPLQRLPWEFQLYAVD